MSDGRTALRRAWDEASAQDRAEVIGLVMNLPIHGPEWTAAGAWDVPPVVVATVTDVGFRAATVTTSRPLDVTLQTVGPAPEGSPR
jgi:hypothetical protein